MAYSDIAWGRKAFWAQEHEGEQEQCIHCRIETCPGGYYRYPEHWHDYPELLYAMEGRFRTVLDGVSYEMEPGDMIFINSRRIHDQLTIGEGRHRFAVLQFEPHLFNSSQSFEFLTAMPFLYTRCKLRCFFPARELGASPVPRAILATCEEEVSQRPGREMAMHMHVLRIFVWLLRQWHREGVSHGEQISLWHVQQVMPAFDHIAMHYPQRLLAADMAEMCGMSYTHFCRQFRDVTGQSFTGYVTQVRIGQAQRLLSTTDMKVTQIAEAVGFADTGHFSQRFRRVVGVSPTRFRSISCQPHMGEEAQFIAGEANRS